MKKRITFKQWYKKRYGIKWEDDWMGMNCMAEEFIQDYKDFCIYENEEQLDIIIDI